MPRAQRGTAKAKQQAPEQALEEGVRVNDIKGLSTEEGGKMASLQGQAQTLQAKTVEIDRAIGKATNLMISLLGAAETDLGKIETQVMELASGDLTTDQLATKYGLTTNQEMSQKLSTLDQVSNSIKVKTREVQVQTEGLELERTKLLRTVKTFEVIGAVADVIDAADSAAHKHHKVAINHQTRQDDLDYTEGKRSLIKDRNDTNLEYRGKSNELEAENEQNILTHKQSVNEILQAARLVTEQVLQAKVDKRKFAADALAQANNGNSKGKGETA